MPRKGADDPVTRYARSVLDGKALAGPLVRAACERHERDLAKGPDRGLWFDPGAVEDVLDFFAILRHSKGEWAGVPFEVEPWEAFILGSIFGWKRGDGLRRFRIAYNEIPRKNGKSTKAAGTGLYLLDMDDEPGAEIYTLATKRKQARIVHEEAIRMARQSMKHSMALRQRIKIVKDNIHVPETHSKYEPLGRDSNTEDGLNAHAAICDELHAWKDGHMWDVLEGSTTARSQPLMYAITTAGADPHSFCGELHDYAARIVKGTIEEDTLFAYIAGLDEGDDPFSPTSWRKANPNYEITVKSDRLEDEARKAREMPSRLNAFLRQHANIWTQQQTRWIPLQLWDENAGLVVEEKLKGQPFYGGLDLSAVSDLTAWILLFGYPETSTVLCRFWCPEARVTDSTNPYRDQYAAWARRGCLTLTKGEAVDYAFVREQVLRDCRTFRNEELRIDALFQGAQLASELIDSGVNVVSFRPTALQQTAPITAIERVLLEKRDGKHGLAHGAHPVLRWMVDGAEKREGAEGLCKIVKGSKYAKIDGVISLIMAMDGAMKAETTPVDLQLPKLERGR